VTQEAPWHLFVYGTLMRASRSPYAKLLQARARFVGEAWAPGRLYHLGGFPGAIFDESCPVRIYGEVFRLRVLSLLDSLDAYEGCGPDMESGLFRRETVKVNLTLGGSLTAWSYPFVRDVSGRTRIASGRFIVSARPIPK
jgi:gamma-glutamylcyclotransferase (GGCT)/AIG2-like uncharacterized protein YtfP